MPCGVDLERFRSLERSAARSRLGIGERDRILLFVGRFAPIKGIDRLISAMANLKHRDDVRLILVGGDGPDAPETLRFKQQVRALGIGGTVEFAGRVPQEGLPAYYAAADALVIPSYYESFGLVVLEALACGTPVLAAPVGVVEELLQDRRARADPSGHVPSATGGEHREIPLVARGPSALCFADPVVGSASRMVQDGRRPAGAVLGKS